MTILIPVFLIFGLSLAGMAVGVLAGRRPIAGSCGGLGQGGTDCGHSLSCVACPAHKEGPIE